MSEIEITRRERKKEATQHRILESALSLFREKGFEATTVDDIAALADVAKGTFFNYFPRKEAVLGTLADQALAELEAFAHELLAGAGTTRERLNRLLSRIALIPAQDRELSRIVILNMLTGHPEWNVNIHGRSHAMVRALIEQGQSRGELRRDVDPDRAASVIHGVGLSTALRWLGCPVANFELDDEMQRQVGLVLEGLAA